MDDRTHPTPLPISDAGDRRRAAMLGELQRSMRLIHRRRRSRRRIAAGACMVVAVLFASIPLWRSPGSPTPGEVAIEPEPSMPNRMSELVIVHTDPNVLARYTPQGHPRTEHLDDDALLEHLASINRPTGLIRMDGQVRLTANVIDPPRNDELPDDDDPLSTL